MECNCTIKTVENSDILCTCMQDIFESIKSGNLPEGYELIPTCVNSDLTESVEEYLESLTENSKIKLMQAYKGYLFSDLQNNVLSEDFWHVLKSDKKPYIPPYVWVHYGDHNKFDHSFKE